MYKPTRKTTTHYKFNAKVGGYQPTNMTVVIEEEIDPEAEMAKQKARQAMMQAQKEEDENIDGKQD